MSGKELEYGWFGQTDDYSAWAYGGFASVDAARMFIVEHMGGRLIKDVILLRKEGVSDDNYVVDLYTTAEFDVFLLVEEWYSSDKPDVDGLTDEDVSELAESEAKNANIDGIGLIGDMEGYLLEWRR